MRKQKHHTHMLFILFDGSRSDIDQVMQGHDVCGADQVSDQWRMPQHRQPESSHALRNGSLRISWNQQIWGESVNGGVRNVWYRRWWEENVLTDNILFIWRRRSEHGVLKTATLVVTHGTGMLQWANNLGSWIEKKWENIIFRVGLPADRYSFR